jgi:hypothetical protein
MAYSSNPKRNHNTFIESFGQKVKDAAMLASSLKSAFETGKMVYSGVQAALPYLETMAMLIP